MKDHYDPWYVRLPDGRTIKAKSTASVRHHVEAGHVPLNSMLRRDPDEEWVALVWVAEFADLAAPSARAMAPPAPAPERPPHPAPGRSGVSARLDPMRLETVGVRGLIDELISALDTTLARTKMVPAFVASILVFVGMFAAHFVHRRVLAGDAASGVPTVVGCAFAVLVLSVLNALLTRLTHAEVSTMRPARLRDGLAGLSGHAVPVVVANALVAGLALLLLFVVSHLSGWVDTELEHHEVQGDVRKVVFTAVQLVSALLAVLAWLVIGLCWLLTPAIVVEESSWLAGIREWRQLVREHFGRVLVYEGLALMLGLAVALPVTAAVSLALYGQPQLLPGWPAPPTAAGGWGAAGVVALLEALTAAPLLAVLGVANVFIYLNLRYEQGPGR